MNRTKNKIVILEYYEGLKESLNLILGDTYTLLFANTRSDVLDYITFHRIELFILDIDDISNALETIKRNRGSGLDRLTENAI